MTDTQPTQHTGSDSTGGVLLRPSELASRRGCSVGHLANLRSRGEGLPYVKIGSRVMYRLADVEAEETSHLVQPAGGNQ